MKRLKNNRILTFTKRHKWITLSIVIVLLLLGFILRPKKPTPLPTQTVSRGDIIQSISGSGSVDSQTTATLSFAIAGKLVYLGAKEGDSVQQGQTIASLDQQTMQKNLESALTDYDLQRDTFDKTEADNGNRTPTGALNDDMKRILEDNQYDLNKAIISVELSDLAKQQSILSSPIEGVVIHEDVSTTDINITPATTFVVANPNNIVFKLDVDEADIAHVKTGQPMKVSLDAYPDKTIDLTVDKIDFASHTTSTGGTAYTVQADFPSNPNYSYRIGMSGDADIITSEKKNVLTVPLASVTENNDVYVKTSKGFVKRHIQTGISSDTDIEITSGLNAGDKVALQPTEAAKQLAKK